MTGEHRRIHGAGGVRTAAAASQDQDSGGDGTQIGGKETDIADWKFDQMDANRLIIKSLTVIESSLFKQIIFN